MISIIGFVSLPVLLLSLVFVYFHTRFIQLHNTFESNKSLLNELELHKLELLLFFVQEYGSEGFCDIHDASLLEQSIIEFALSEEDRKEIDDISKEIKYQENMYNQSKQAYNKFKSKFPGSILVTFFAGKSAKL